MTNLNEIAFYNELMELKRANMKVRNRALKRTACIMAPFIFLSLKFNLFFMVPGIVVSVLYNVIVRTLLLPDYEKFYYQKFFPELLNSLDIYDLKLVSDQQGSNFIRSSGLFGLSQGFIHQMGCFKRERNEFKYFGYYEKIKKERNSEDNSYSTTFEGTFFIKQLEKKSDISFKLIMFKAQKPNIFNKKGYTGKCFLNDEKFILSEKSVKLLKELQDEYGKVSISLHKKYLAVQFYKLRSCICFGLNPYLKKGEDTEDHFKIIELSNRDSKISYILFQVLEDIKLNGGGCND